MSVDIVRKWRRFTAYNRVRVTILLGLLYLAFSVPTADGLWVGSVLVAVGQGIRFWAAGFLEKNVRLANAGPYRVVRHPLYLGSLVMGLGLVVVAAAAIWWFVAYLLLFIGFFLPAIHVEELRLQSIFGAEYQDLMVEVPGLIPRPFRLRVGAAPSVSSFSWGRVVANRELRSAAAMAALIALQGAKLWLG